MASDRSILLQDNLDLLQQGIRVIEDLTPEEYALNQHQHFSSGVGKHMRHVLDFYERFLTGSDTVIDYDARSRDPRIESERDYAALYTRDMVRRIHDLVSAWDGSPDVSVRVESCDASGKGMITRSTLERELAHLSCHTIHHYAMIAMIVRILGKSCPEQFGVAPSTIRYLASQAD